MITELLVYSEHHQKMARFAKALGHPARVMIVELLKDEIGRAHV